MIQLLCTMDIPVEPENDGLVQMIFLFQGQGARILRFQPSIFRDVSETEKYFPNIMGTKKEEILWTFEDSIYSLPSSLGQD